MLSEEEKKAIEWLKNKPDECTNIINSSSYIGNKKAYAKERTNFKTVLNLITKLQKENEEKDKELEDLKEIKNIADSKITDLRKIKDYDKLQSEIWILQTKLKEKDKQIDLMAEYWNTGIAMCDNCDKIVEKYEENTCKECIKQYFETKAKEGK